MSTELEGPHSDILATPPATLPPLPVFPSTPLEIDDYARLLAPHLPDGVDVTKMNLAYGRRAIPKLVKKIFFSSLSSRLLFLAYFIIFF
jgi:hypothetical protein